MMAPVAMSESAMATRARAENANVSREAIMFYAMPVASTVKRECDVDCAG